MLLLVVSACGGGSDAGGPASVASVTLTLSTTAMIAGTTQIATAVPRDAKGNAITGRTLRWITSNSTVATVEPSGFITAVTPGSATITVETEGRSASAALTVTPVPIATVAVSPGTATVFVGATTALSAQPRDAAGNPLSGRSVVWSSGNPAIATVSAAGAVTAVAVGTTTVTATSEERSGSATITVEPMPEAPIIANVTPAVLVPGASATITGVGFEPTIAANGVTVNGIVAPVTSASPTQLVVTVPCVETGAVAVRAIARGVTGQPFARTAAATQRTLAPGQSLVLTSSAPSLCNELVSTSATARYLVTVFSAATSANTLVDFELGGATSTTGRTVVARSATGAPLAEERPLDDAQDRRHFEHLEAERARYETGMRRWRALPAAQREASRSLRAAPPTLGDKRDFYYVLDVGCGDSTRIIPARAIHIGTRAVIWEDTTNVLQSSANAMLLGYYERLARIYDEDQHVSLRNTFGDPLRRDALTDNDGVVHMVFSQKLNGTGAAAYVTSCDQFPRSVYPGSNFGEVFYGQVPTVGTPNVNSTASPDGWFYFMARTVVHEVKHIVSMAARVANNSPGYEQSWLEEGTARHAEEVWIRESLHKIAWKANTGFGTAATNGVYCDFHPADATCNSADPLRRPSFGMRRQFDEIRPKLLQPWAWSPYGDGTGQSGSVFYQTVWSLVRYTIDRYGSSDANFFRTLINSTTSGTANLSAVAGVPMDQLIGGWGLALYADDYPGLTGNPDIQFPTWNLRSIYGGLNTSPNWTSRWNTPFPLQPTALAFGEFNSRVTGMRGGAHAYFEIGGDARPTQLIAIRGNGGGVASTNLRVAVLRLQ